jgi:hypothetical protein
MDTISRRMVDLRSEESGAFGPLSHQRSRFILGPTGSRGVVFRTQTGRHQAVRSPAANMADCLRHVRLAPGLMCNAYRGLC